MPDEFEIVAQSDEATSWLTATLSDDYFFIDDDPIDVADLLASL